MPLVFRCSGMQVRNQEQQDAKSGRDALKLTAIAGLLAL